MLREHICKSQIITYKIRYDSIFLQCNDYAIKETQVPEIVYKYNTICSARLSSCVVSIFSQELLQLRSALVVGKWIWAKLNLETATSTQRVVVQGLSIKEIREIKYLLLALGMCTLKS